MAESDLFQKTVESIRSAGLNGGAWPDALIGMTRLFGSVGATLEVFQKRPMSLIDFHVEGLPERAGIEYLDHYAEHNPRAAFAFRHLSEVTLCDYQLIDESAMNRDAYYAKYLTSIDLRYFLSGQIMNTRDVQGVVTIQRSRRQGHVEQREIDWMRRLLPHVRQAHDVATRLKGAGSAQRSLEAALDWLSDGVALLGADHCVLHANEAFWAIARRGDGIRVVKRQIEFAAAEARTLFARAFTAAAGDGAPQSPTDFVAEREGPSPPYLVSLRWAAPAPMPRHVAQDALAILFVHDPLAGTAPSVQALRQAFGLTEAEADLALALLAGLSPADYALKRLLSRNTVYTHLRRIREKTHCARLPELIRKLNEARSAVRSH